MIANLEQLLLLISVILGFSAAIIILFFNDSSKKQVNRILLLSLLPFTFFNLMLLLYSTGLILEYPHLLRLHRPFLFLIGPGFYLYTNMVLQSKINFGRKDALHFIPFIISFFIELPFYLENIETKKIIAEKIVSSEIDFQTLVKCNIGACWLVPVILFSITFYLALSWLKYYNSNKQGLINNSKHIKNYLILQTVIFIICIFSSIISTRFGLSTSINLFVFSGSLISSAAILFFKPKLLYGYILKNAEYDNNKPVFETHQSELKFNHELKEKYLQSIEDFLACEEKVIKQKLTITKMSEETKIPQHHLSAFINSEMHMNFNDLLNKRRIEIAKKYLLDENYKQYSFEGIGRSVGFNSKTSFYSAFKKFVGTTPAEFAKSFDLRKN